MSDAYEFELSRIITLIKIEKARYAETSSANLARLQAAQTSLQVMCARLSTDVRVVQPARILAKRGVQ